MIELRERQLLRLKRHIAMARGEVVRLEIEYSYALEALQKLRRQTHPGASRFVFLGLTLGALYCNTKNAARRFLLRFCGSHGAR